MYVYLASIAGNGLCAWRTKKKEVFTFDHDGAGTGNQTTSVSLFSLYFPCVCFHYSFLHSPLIGGTNSNNTRTNFVTFISSSFLLKPISLAHFSYYVFSLSL